MTEADARILLSRSSGNGGMDGWMAEQPWQVEVGGWTIPHDLQGWRIRIEVIAAGLRITAKPPSGSLTAWIVAG